MISLLSLVIEFEGARLFELVVVVRESIFIQGQVLLMFLGEVGHSYQCQLAVSTLEFVNRPEDRFLRLMHSNPIYDDDQVRALLLFRNRVIKKFWLCAICGGIWRSLSLLFVMLLE